MTKPAEKYIISCRFISLFNTRKRNNWATHYFKSGSWVFVTRKEGEKYILLTVINGYNSIGKNQ